MARSEGLALAPWGILGGGRIQTDAEEARRRESGEKGRMIFHSNWERTEEERRVSLVFEEVAKDVGVEGITAGAHYLLPNCGRATSDVISDSCDCIPPSQGAVCLPHHLLPQGGAFSGESEGTGHHLDP